VSKQRYTSESKDEAARQVTEKEHSVQEVATQLNRSRFLSSSEPAPRELAFADFVRAIELRPGWEPALTRVQQYRAKGFDESDQ